MRDRLLLFFLGVFCVFAASSPSAAWGPEGHRITGEVATAFLKEQTKAEIARILGNQSLAEAALWADDVRNEEKYEWTKPLHYINVPRRALELDMKRDCENGLCVVAAIRRFEQQLRDPATSASDRRDALRFLIHFIGDIHQPLHVSYRDDLGGNQIDVTYLGSESNLHRVWDTDLIRTRMKTDDSKDLARELLARLESEPKPQETWRKSLDPEDWANQSLLATRIIYRSLPRGGILDEQYYEQHIKVVETQLMMAGIRLAAMLNDIYALDEDEVAEVEETPEQVALREAMNALEIVEGGECGNEGRIMFLVNRHGSRMIQARIRRTWVDRGRSMSHETVEVVRPGEANKRELGCTHRRTGRDVREFTWEIVEARFR